MLDYFGEEPVNLDNADLCCDVCADASSQRTVNCLPEIQAILRVVEELPSSGEKKVMYFFHV